MRFKILIIFVFGLLLSSCSSSRKTTTTSKKKSKSKKVKVVETKPNKTPSVNQIKHIKKLEKGNASLNKYTLQYIRNYAPLAVSEMHKSKIPASITLAQGILESGNGRSELARKSNNHFGIKCHKGWNGGRVYHDDDAKGECFRKYRYPESSYHDHSAFLTSRRRYADLFKLRRNDYKGWAKGLKKAGYATDKKYPKKLIKLIETYKLYEFDKFSKRDLKRNKKVKEEVVEKPKTKKKNSSSKKYYTVVKGDTLYSISRKFGLTVDELKKKNKLKSNTLSIGQELKIK